MTVVEQGHTVDDGDGVCGDCQWCQENTGGDCIVLSDPKCAWCGHCAVNHGGAPPTTQAIAFAIENDCDLDD
jgi:hypothetical protein